MMQHTARALADESGNKARWAALFGAPLPLGLKTILVLMVALASPARSEQIDGTALMKLCQVFIDTPREPIAYACPMYITGVYDALNLWDPFWNKVCVPDSFSIPTLTYTVLDYIKGIQRNAPTLQ
jgi:hypothetical protein